MIRDQLAVWGDPIAHSRSPLLHAAAYGVLGLDWDYGRRRVDGAGFADALASLDGSWRGLSLTMPLKEHAHRAADSLDDHARLTGAVNTLLLGDRRSGFNTDVGGIVDALADEGIGAPKSVRILGAGATAASALAAVAECGARDVEIRARRPDAAAALQELGGRLGVDVQVDVFAAPTATVDLTIATLPSGTTLDDGAAERLSRSGGVLFDVAYAPWPSSLAARWRDGRALSGQGMLLRQAVRQIRIFLGGDQGARLPQEDDVVRAMRAALGT